MVKLSDPKYLRLTHTNEKTKTNGGFSGNFYPLAKTGLIFTQHTNTHYCAVLCKQYGIYSVLNINPVWEIIIFEVELTKEKCFQRRDFKSKFCPNFEFFKVFMANNSSDVLNMNFQACFDAHFESKFHFWSDFTFDSSTSKINISQTGLIIRTL